MTKLARLILPLTLLILSTGCGSDQKVEDTVYGIIAANPGKPFKPCDDYFANTQYEALARLVKKGKVVSKGDGLEIVP